jgi:hypothetical protein
MKSKANHFHAIAATLLIGIGVALTSASPALAVVAVSDSVTVGTVNGPQFSTVDVPVFIRDSSSTPLGTDQPAGFHIQAYAIKVNYAPASAVQSITFTRGGVTTSLTPASESSPSSAGSVSLIDSFSETTNPIPLTLNGALPGDQVATLHVTLANTAAPGTIITLTLDPTSLTQLSNDTGTVGEMVSNGSLTLVSGAITVVPSVPALGHIALLVLAISLAFIAIRSRF